MPESMTALIVVGVIAAGAIVGCLWVCVAMARSLRDTNERLASLSGSFANALMATSDYQLDRIRAEMGQPATTQRPKHEGPVRRATTDGLTEAELQTIDNLG